LDLDSLGKTGNKIIKKDSCKILNKYNTVRIWVNLRVREVDNHFILIGGTLPLPPLFFHRFLHLGSVIFGPRMLLDQVH
jgi:hypothetical protein